MKKVLFFLSILILASMACDMSVPTVSPTSPNPLPTNIVIPATEVPTQIPATATISPTTTALQPSFEGMEVSVAPLRVILSPKVASGASGIQVPASEGDSAAGWDMAPAHIELQLEGYVLQNKFHEPKIYVYPALAYAEMLPAAFESIRRLDNILYPPDGPNINNPLPAVPFFNAAQVFASNIQLISFQNGQGVRFLTEYAQYADSVNNHDLFYHFEGVTRDGAYYIVAILPITAPTLAETSDAGAPLPPGGVPYPYYADPNADMQSYYKSVTDVLNATPAEAFTPTITQLDQLIQSMQIQP